MTGCRHDYAPRRFAALACPAGDGSGTALRPRANPARRRAFPTGCRTRLGESPVPFCRNGCKCSYPGSSGGSPNWAGGAPCGTSARRSGPSGQGAAPLARVSADPASGPAPRRARPRGAGYVPARRSRRAGLGRVHAGSPLPGSPLDDLVDLGDVAVVGFPAH